MKIYKQSKTDVFSQQAYANFVAAIKQKSITWDDRGQQFQHASNVGDFMVMEKILYGTIHAEKGIRTPDYALRIHVFQKTNLDPFPSKWEVSLLNEKNRMALICAWSNESPNEDCIYGKQNGSLSVLLKNLSASIKLPKEETTAIQSLRKSTGENGQTIWGFERLTKAKSRFDTAKAIEIWIEKDNIVFSNSIPRYIVFYRAIELESDFYGDTKTIKEQPGDPPMTASEVIQIYENYIARAKSNGYVSRDSFEYIPNDAKPSNWDFTLNQYIKVTENKVIENEEQPITYPKLRKILFDTHLKTITAQDFGGYYSGSVPAPEQAFHFIGTPQVEASQIKSVFGKADEAISLVNTFNGDLLKNIAFIFNSQGGSYGVYLSEMDRAIKTKFLAKQLEQKGYKVTNNNGVLTANPTDENISNEQIQQDIDALYDELNRKGGTAIGINVSKIIDSARQDASNIPSPEPNYLFEQLAILHLGETIVHEAVHAKGSHSEGPSEMAEANFVNWYLPQLNEKYRNHLSSIGKENEYVEVILGTTKRHAISLNWYKMAQNYGGLYGQPIGSDLSGRMQGKYDNGGMAEWGLMFNQNAHDSIEKRLSRQYMWPLSRDIDQSRDITEEQLRKSTREINKPENDKTTEELLGKDRMEIDDSYKSMEVLLDEKRPAPLMRTLKKAFIIKTSTLFGWYNNLEISDGNTIPGLGDRVMAWDDRDEDFATDEETIRRQPRYNPEYDSTGFYYRFIEPRFKPQTFDDMNSNLSNTHPARRFASIEENDSTIIGEIISRAKNILNSQKVKALRFIVSEDLLEHIVSSFSEYGTVICPMKGKDNDVFALWIKNNEVADQDIADAEKYFSGDMSFESKVEELTGMIQYRRKIVEKLFSTIKKICTKNNLQKVYLVGEAAREYILGAKITNPFLHFVCENKEDSIRYGQILCGVLGEEFYYNKNNDLVFRYCDLKIYFHGGNNEQKCELMDKISSSGYDTRNPIIFELLNKDFRINMIGYSVCDDKILDPINAMKDINDKKLDTEFDAELVIKSNPLIIVRAIKFINVDGFSPSEQLATAIENNYDLLRTIDDNASEQARFFWKFNRIT